MNEERKEKQSIAAPARRIRRRSAGRTGNQIDIRGALEAPVRVKRDGSLKAIDPYEAMLRQHVRRSLIDQCVTSIKFVLGEAEKHKLIREPPPREQGGVFIVPKNLPEEIQKKICDHPDYAKEERMGLPGIMALLLPVIGIKGLMRCFNGRKDE